jgi:hypothetical protein
MVKIEGENLRDKISQHWSEQTNLGMSFLDLELDLIVNVITYAILNPCETVIGPI